MTPVRGPAPDTSSPDRSRNEPRHSLLWPGLLGGLLLLGIALQGWGQPGVLAIAAGLAVAWAWMLAALRRAERRDAAWERRMVHVQHLALLGTWRWQVGGRTVEWGGESAAIYGFPDGTSRVSLDDAFRCIHPDDRAEATRWLDAARSAAAGGLPAPLEYRVVRTDGSVRWVMSRVEAEERGGVRTLFGVQQDITPQAMDRERLRMAQQTARVGDWEWDIDSGRVRWSEAMYSIYGLDHSTPPPTNRMPTMSSP